MNKGSMETVAEYRESKIRTYGFELHEGLNLWKVTLADHESGSFGYGLGGLASIEPRFEWLLGHPEGLRSINLWLMCDDVNSEMLSGLPDAATGRIDEQLSATCSGRVDVVSFQGPHFGDRFGILDYTISALAAHEIPVLAMTGSISVVCLVLPLGQGRRTKAALETVFEIPNASSRKDCVHPKDSG